MSARLRERLAASLSVVLLLALAASTYYLSELSHRLGGQTAAPRVGHEADSYAEGVVLTRLNQQGGPVFRLAAQRVVHYRDDGSSTYLQPVIVSLDASQPEVIIRADRGESDAAGQTTILEGSVRLDRAASPESPAVTILTEYAVLDAEQEIARTDRPVTVVRDRSVLTGVGMQFNNPGRTLLVETDVRGTFQPPARNR